MYIKIIYTIIAGISVLLLSTETFPLSRKKQSYAKWLMRLLIAAAVAVLANIFIAISPNAVFAKVAYSVYFAGIDWIALFLLGLFLSYTGFTKALKYIKWPVFALMVMDSISLLLNFFFEHVFYIYTKAVGTKDIFYLTKFTGIYDIHLVLDYLVIALGLAGIIVKIFKSHSYYRYNYLIIMSVLLFVIVLNIVYMAFSLTLDWSVLLYAIAGMMLHFCMLYHIPEKLTGRTIKKATDEMNDGLMLFDINDVCLYHNKFMDRHFSNQNEEYTLDMPIIRAVIGNQNPANATSDVKEFTFPGANKAADRHYKIYFDKLSDKAGHYLGAYFLIEDITVLKSNMIELDKARKAADAASIAKSNFLANMSHEIRTPINSVLGMNEMILRESKDPQILEYAANVSSAGNSLLGLINDILDFSKIEAGKMDIIEADYSLHKMLRDCYHMLSTRATDKGLSLKFDIDPNLPSSVYGDENRIRQVLSNLITNGIKYTKRGTITVKVTSEKSDNDFIILHMSVTDTGIGISEENQEKLFTAFQRLDQERNRNIEGTGLGLAITKQLLTLMKGDITVTSKLGAGSCFSVFVPQKVTDSTPSGEFMTTLVKGPSQYHESFTAPDAEILIVDDVPMNLKVASMLLKKTLVKIDLSEGGLDAFEKCKNKKYDIVFMDHMMPAPDGVAAFKMIRESGANTETPVVVLTANAINGVEKEYREIGFTDYLSKPVRGEDLEAMVLRLLPPEKVRQQNK